MSRVSLFTIATLFIASISVSTTVMAQGGVGDAGNLGGGNAFNDLFGGGGNNGGSFDGLSLGDNAFSLQNEIEVAPSQRFEIGYVGPTGNDVNGEGADSRSVGFVGQRNEGELGGGVNDSISLGGGNTGNRAGGGQAGGFVGGGTALYFEVQRRGIRARLRPAFAFRATIDNRLMASQFVSRLDRLPATRGISKGYSVQIENKTAVITGVVNSVEESKGIERQLRLEPGIYRINNQLQIRQ